LGLRRGGEGFSINNQYLPPIVIRVTELVSVTGGKLLSLRKSDSAIGFFQKKSRSKLAICDSLRKGAEEVGGARGQ